MKIDDPWLGSATVEWRNGVETGVNTKRMLDLLESLANLLTDSGEQYADGAIAQIRDQMAILRRFLSRLPHHYGANGLCQEFYRLSGLGEDFDRFGDKQISKSIAEIVSLADESIFVGELSTT